MQTQKPRAVKGQTCPLLRKDVAQVCHKCPWWTHLRGKNPQSSEEVDHWVCAIASLPILTIESAQQTRQAGAAIESFRNEVVKLNGGTMLLAGAADAPRALPGA